MTDRYYVFKTACRSKVFTQFSLLAIEFTLSFSFLAILFISFVFFISGFQIINYCTFGFFFGYTCMNNIFVLKRFRSLFYQWSSNSISTLMIFFFETNNITFVYIWHFKIGVIWIHRHLLYCQTVLHTIISVYCCSVFSPFTFHESQMNTIFRFIITFEVILLVLQFWYRPFLLSTKTVSCINLFFWPVEFLFFFLQNSSFEINTLLQMA